MEDFTIYKADDDKRLVFGWASIAITVDGEVLEDRQGDMIEPEDLEEAAYDYVLNFRDTGEEHLPGYRKKGKLVESVVLTKEKQRAMGIPEGILPVGWWLGFYIEDDDAWRRVKDGTYKMFSIEGKAERLPVEKQVKPGAGVLVVRDGKLLTGTRLESRTKGQICGPGGHIEGNETPAEAAAREAREEFGIECRTLKPIGVSKDGLTHMFMCYDFTGEPKTDDKEITDPQWRAPEELEGLKLFAPFEESLNHVPRRTAKSFTEVAKYNHNHGADGKFSSSPGAGGGSSSGNGGGSGGTTAQTHTAKQVESIIRNEKDEIGCVINPDGEIIMAHRGTPNSVHFTDEEISRMKDCTFTHNHPNDSPLSPQDIRFMEEGGAFDVRAAGNEGHTYSLRRTGELDVSKVAAFREEYDKAFTEAGRNSFKAYQEDGYDKKIKSGELTEKEVRSIIYGLWREDTVKWAVENAPKYGLIYECTTA